MNCFVLVGQKPDLTPAALTLLKENISPAFHGCAEKTWNLSNIL